LTDKRQRVFSGVQPTGNIHIGNYLGALRQFVSLQEEGECIYCIVDLHAITLKKEPEELRNNIMDVAALYYAVGIDLKKSIVFVQSDVPGHTELSWILTCNSYMGELFRMTQFKDKSRGGDTAPTGLFIYPTLMASDILLYDTNTVPVGNDQKQHIELTRDLAIRINNRFGDDTFVVPEGRFLKEGARVMAFDDPTTKMSKSSESEMSRICLLDEDSKIKKAIMRSTTDSGSEIRYDAEEKPGISNLLSIMSSFSGKSLATLEKDYTGLGYGALKKDLAETAIEKIRPIREKYKEIRRSDELTKSLKEGAERAGLIAEATMKRVKAKFGLGS
jgi:tryptophanyl-tRNA synthetase